MTTFKLQSDAFSSAELQMLQIKLCRGGHLYYHDKHDPPTLPALLDVKDLYCTV